MGEREVENNKLYGSEMRPLVGFYLLAFGISWLGYVPTIASSVGATCFRSAWWNGTLILSAVGPAAAASLVTLRSCSPENVDDAPLNLFRRAFLKPVSIRWWAVAIMLATGIMLVAALLTSGIDHAPVITQTPMSSLVFFSILSLAANPLEEIGWRGFAQNRLQRTLSPLLSAVIVGVLWAVWHVPLFLLSNHPMSMSHVPFWPWAAGVIPQAILLAWLYNATKENLAIVSVFHVLGNISGEVFHSSHGMVSAVRCAAVLVVICIAGPHLAYARSRLTLRKALKA